MSLKESAEVKPLRLKIVTVGAKRHGGEPGAPHGGRRSQLARFLALNGLGPHDQVKPGSKVKMVVE